MCKRSLPYEKFLAVKCRADGFATYCKECFVGVHKRWYEKNKQRHKSNTRKWNELNRSIVVEFVTDYLRKHPCVDCNLDDINVLEFDHVIGTKINNISTMRGNRTSLKKIKSEMEKCEVRCANCHRRKTKERLGILLSR